MTFDPIIFSDIDVETRALSRILIQFRKSPVFLQVLEAFMSELQIFINASRSVMQNRTCADAIGENLNVIGRIVGQIRELIDYDVITWFTPDTAYATVDRTPVWVTNAPLANSYLSDDYWFRKLIEAKISRNFVIYGSVTEIQDTVRRALDLDISVVNVDGSPLTVLLIVPDDTSLNDMMLLQRQGDTDNCSNVFFIPLPAGVQIANVIRLSDYIRHWDDSSLYFDDSSLYWDPYWT